MTEQVDRREGRRLRIDLPAQVTAEDADGKTFKEKTRLRNMSGGGASFITRQADRYFHGQRLDLQIDLPGTADLNACLQGAATVSRIKPLPDTDPGEGARGYAVAVMIVAPLQFIRKDAGPRAEKTRWTEE